MKVSIRGLGTVGNSAPLYLIDGVGGDISTLNPADIESMSILKDAASASPLWLTCSKWCCDDYY